MSTEAAPTEVTQEVQSTILSEEEVTQVVEGTEPEAEVQLPSDTQEFEIPEKFQDKSPEEIIKAYMELEKKLGSKEVQPEAETEPTQETETESKPEVEKKPIEQDKLNELIQSYEVNGGLTDEQYSELEKLGYSKEDVDNDIEYYEFKKEKRMKDLLEPIGLNKDTFKEMNEWVIKNKSEEEINAFNDALAKADLPAKRLLIQGLHSEYTKVNGEATTDPIHSNKPTYKPTKGYQTQEEFFKDMNHPDYHTNPKFRKMVEDKMAVSDIF